MMVTRPPVAVKPMRTYSLLNSVVLMRGQKAYSRSSDIRIKLDLARVLRAKCALVTLLQIIDRWGMLRCRHLEFRQSLGSLGDQDMQHPSDAKHST